MDSEKLKQLRDQTGLSFNLIKKALDKAGDDAVKALEILKSHGALMAEKKSTRELKAGIIEAYVHSNKKLGCICELLCETDFVARNDEFKSLAHHIAMHIAAMKPTNNEELLSQSFVKDPSQTVKDLIVQSTAKLGENIQVGRFKILEI